MKARDIEPNMNFHGAEGTTPLRRSEPAGVGPVYNLIVADFHSYFVGKASSTATTSRPANRPIYSCRACRGGERGTSNSFEHAPKVRKNETCN